MTYKERLQQEHPENVIKQKSGNYWCCGCPSGYGYNDTSYCKLLSYANGEDADVDSDVLCNECWNREIPEGGETDEE